MRSEKILVISPNWVGDAVMAIPMVSLLRKEFSLAHIAILTKSYLGDIWKSNAAVNEIICFDSTDSVFYGNFYPMVHRLGRGKFNTAIILSHYASHAALTFFAGIPVRIGYAVRHRKIFLTHPFPYSSAVRTKHMVENYIDFLLPLGIRSDPQSLVMRLETSAKESAARILAEKGISINDTIIGVAPGARFGPAKRWPAEYYFQLLRTIGEDWNIKTAVFTGPADQEIARQLKEHAGKNILFFDGVQSLTTVAALVARCTVLVSNDSGLIHIAAAVGTKTVGIYCSTSPVWTRPYGEGHIILSSDVPCRPCFNESCRDGSYRCLHAVGVQDVVAAVHKQFYS